MTPRPIVAPASALVAALLAALALAACGGGGGPAPAASDGAARVVPGTALAFISVQLDTRSSAVAQTVSTLADISGYRRTLAAVRRRLSEITGVDFGEGIQPWLGTEAAVAFVPDGAGAGAGASELIVLGVRRPAAARRFSARVRAPFAARLIDGYVVIGEPAAVAAAGRGSSLGASRAFRHAVAAEPSDRVLDAYASGVGLRELLAGRTGLAGVAADVLATPHVSSVAAALVPTSDGLRLRVALRTDTTGPAPSFTPTLAGRLPAATTWMVDMPSLTRSAPGLLGVLAAGSGRSGTAGLASRLGIALAAQGVAVAPLESLFSHESAIFELDGSLGLITRTPDATAARLELGAAGAALAELFAPGPGAGVVPVVSTGSVGHVAVTEYQTGPSSQLDDAVVGGDAVITTSHVALVAIIDRKATLSGSSLYQSVLAGSGPSVSPVLYGAINRLIRRDGEAGTLEQLGLLGAAPALAQISAAGLASTGKPSETTAELYFTIS